MFTFKRIETKPWQPKRYSVCKKGVGYIGDVFKTGGWKGRIRNGRWWFEDTQLNQKLIGTNWRTMLKGLRAL